MTAHDVQESSTPSKFRLAVVYNGVEKMVAVEPHEQVKALLQAAIHAFAIVTQPHLLSLFRADGTKIDEHESVERAGLHPGDVIFLRQDVVKGGGGT